MNYTPKPLDVSQITLPTALAARLEELSQNTHEIWAQGRIDDGWQYGAQRDDARKLHPGLVPYAQLSEQEKAYDRRTTENAIKALLLLGAEISFNSKE